MKCKCGVPLTYSISDPDSLAEDHICYWCHYCGTLAYDHPKEPLTPTYWMMPQVTKELLNIMSQKKQMARDSLPEELRAIFDDFVEEYKFCSTLRIGSPYICYAVMADLVKAGWRKSADGLLPKEPEEK